MELIMIIESKLKIMLTSDDLQGFELTAEDLDYTNTETKRMFWDVLGRAKRAIGFDTDGHRVLVQLYPSRSGGCEMFISKICVLSRTEGEGKTDLHAVIKSADEKPSPHEKKQISAYGFDGISPLLAVCRRLMGIGYAGKSEAYFGDDRRAYLLLSMPEDAGLLPLDEFSFITEYGSRENADALRQYLGEHARPICLTGAVDALAKF